MSEIKEGSIVKVTCDCGSSFCNAHLLGIVTRLYETRARVIFPGLDAQEHVYAQSQVDVIGEIDHE